MATIAKQSQLTPQIKVHISQTVTEVLNDPDFGLELSEKAKRRLDQARTLKQAKVTFDEVKKRYSSI